MERDVMRAEDTAVPYHTDFVHTVVEPHSVTAFWSPVPVRDPQHVMDNILNRQMYPDVEIVATAERVYARDGAATGYAGWFVRCGASVSDRPYTRKADAMDALAREVNGYMAGQKSYWS